MAQTAPLYRPAYGGDLLVRGLSRNPDKPAVYLGDRVITSGEVADQISRYVQAYEAWGIGEGSRTATLTANRPEVLFNMGAGMVAGCRTTALHPMGSLDDHVYILEDAEIETLFYDPAAYEERAMALKDRVAGLKRVVALAPTDAAEDLSTAAGRFGSRQNALSGDRSTPTSISEELSIAATAALMPPAKASSGCGPNCCRICGSIIRPERIGSIRAAFWHW